MGSPPGKAAQAGPPLGGPDGAARGAAVPPAQALPHQSGAQGAAQATGHQPRTGGMAASGEPEAAETAGGEQAAVYSEDAGSQHTPEQLFEQARLAQQKVDQIAAQGGSLAAGQRRMQEGRAKAQRVEAAAPEGAALLAESANLCGVVQAPAGLRAVAARVMEVAEAASLEAEAATQRGA